MSELELNNKEYNTLVSIIWRLNEALITIKKYFLLKNGATISNKIKCSNEEYEKAINEFDHFISDLYFRSKDTYTSNIKNIPAETISSINTIIKKESNEQIIKSALSRLKNKTKLEARHFTLLDLIVQMLDCERSNFVKKRRNNRE